MVNCVVMNPSQVRPCLALNECCPEKTPNVQADTHETAYREGKTPEEQWGPEIVAMVEKRRKEAQEWLDIVM